MSNFKVGDKFVVEIAEIYKPEDAEKHPTNASNEIYRMKNIPPLINGQLSNIPKLEDVIAKKTGEKSIKWITIKESGYPKKEGIYIVHTGANNYFTCEYEVDNTFVFYNGMKVREVDAWLAFPYFNE